MKSKWIAALAAAGCVVPAVSFAQDNSVLSRAQVREEMARYEQAGFNPARQNPSRWVEDLQAAAARVHAEHDAVRMASGAAAVGGVGAGN
ncbi:DUF4148 domain-containing protein [Burkholderia gladioli]|uniref:DUF4148 domain-containing protein n=1 Tax=Burkholderia gladioli TaxID=28095 RepID=UPI001364D60B|nr:DUF4148 domain-containing protein [Burkholderia gladioli]KAF1059459.1 hypothetical protein LvStA_06058 [Burkholderia gladioli]WAG23560.1 DUF4148 domain-containing protein [Burkholderia gladioli]